MGDKLCIALCAESEEENKKEETEWVADGITLVLGPLWGIFNTHRPQGCS